MAVRRPIPKQLFFAMAMLAAGCSSLHMDTCCVAAKSLPEFKTIQIIGVSSSLHGRPMNEDDPALRNRLRLQLQRAFPNARFVDEGGDLEIIFILADYVPGCLPNCGRFPTYRHWTGEVMTWVPKPGTDLVSGTQVVSVEGSGYNPFADPIARFVTTFKRYWTSAHAPK